MNKLLTTILTLFLFSSVYAETLTLSNDIHEVPFEQITFKNTIAYTNGKPYTGRVVEYKDDKRFLEYGYKNGIQQGLEIGWHTKTGKKSYESNWNEGKKEGLYIRYWPNGKKRSSVNYINDVKEGLKTVWHKNGQTDYQQNYSGGTRLGSQFIPKSVKTSLSASKSSTKKNSTQFKTVKFKKLSKQDIFETFSDKFIVFDISDKGYNNNRKYPACIKITEDSTIEELEPGKYKSDNGAMINCNKMRLKDAWVEYMSGKLCIENRRSEKCKRIRKFSNEKYKFGFSPISIHSKLSPMFKTRKKSKVKKTSTSVTSLFIGPDSMKTTVYRGGDVAEQTETVFVDRNHRVKGEKELREKWRAKWKAAWKEGRTIDDLEKEEFVLNPDLERRFSKYRDDAIGLFYSDNKKDREEAVVILRKLAFAGSSPAYYDLIFRSPDSSYEEDNKLQFYKLFGNMFEYSFSKRDKTKVSNEMIILAKDNLNNNADQNELIRSLLLLSQKKFQHYNHLINIAGADMFLSYMILSMPGGQSDAKTEYFLAARFDRNEIGEITDYLLTNEEIVRNLEKEAEEGDVMSMMFLVNMYNPEDMYKTLNQIVPPTAEKAIFYSKKIIEYIKAHKDDVDIKKSPSLARKAYETLRELKDESILKEVNIYFKDIDEAKANKQREIRKQGQFCTVSFMEGDNPKRKTYRYYKTKDCLAHIKHADENGYLNKGRFKNGNNPLIFWGPQGTYEGTKNLMKNHKPLNK